MQETQVQSLGQADLLEEGMTTHSISLVWRTPRTEESRRLQSMGLQRVAHECVTKTSTFFFTYICTHTIFKKYSFSLWFIFS